MSDPLSSRTGRGASRREPDLVLGENGPVQFPHCGLAQRV
jgi:hypothetical protein